MDFYENLKKYTNVRTISIAFPSSIFDNVPTPQLEAYLVGQIARAACVFNVSEIVIFDEDDNSARSDRVVKLFEYAECPQYLRKSIFGLDPDLKYAGLIHPLEAQHHLRTSQIECPYREGITISHVTREVKKEQVQQTEVNIGLSKPVVVTGTIDLNTRVTVKVDPSDLKKMQALLAPAKNDRPEALLVPPVEPYQKLNLYWGYYVRKAASLSKVMDDNVFAPGKKFYDLIIGTSEKGDNIDKYAFSSLSEPRDDGKGPVEKNMKKTFEHILVVFGGIRGLEHSAQCDEKLKDHSDIRSLFHFYLNTCPKQGSTTIRTEEAILITLSALRPKLSL